jgi:hypothetical protein
VATRDEKFREAAWGYVAYGIVYWLGGLLLMAAGLGPRRLENAGGFERSFIVMLFVAAGLLVILVPWLLIRERPWFSRWILSRRDFARILTLFVAFRAVEVGRIARAPRSELVSLFDVAVPMRIGAWVFFLVTVAMVILLARAAWSRES